MNIKLNLLDNYYMFYDWLDTDNIKEYNNLTLCKVKTNIISDLILYKVKINNDFKNNIIIFSDGFTYIAIKFINKISTLKSSIILEDEEKLETKIDKLPNTNLKYEKLERESDISNLRINDEIKNTIINEINTSKNDFYKIKYLYYLWFNKENDSIDNMYNEMLKKINSDISLKEIDIYNIIKKEYKLV